MTDRVLALGLALALVAVPLAARAQQMGKVYRIGALREGPDPQSRAFVEAMRELGWIEGQNFILERRTADRREQLPALAAELVQLKVDLILATGTPATSAAKEATRTIPIVFTLGTDPVDTGLVTSFARPGGNLTGFALGICDVKLLEALKDAVPRVSRVAYPAPVVLPLIGPDPCATPLERSGPGPGSRDYGHSIAGPGDIDAFFPAAKRAGDSAVVVPNLSWLRPHLKRIGVAAARSGLPSIGYDRQFAESGGLLSYGPAPLQNIPRLAAQIDRILKGAKPGDLPVEQPTKFEFVINLKTAKALGLTIPPAVLARADQVVE